MIYHAHGQDAVEKVMLMRPYCMCMCMRVCTATLFACHYLPSENRQPIRPTTILMKCTHVVYMYTYTIYCTHKYKWNFVRSIYTLPDIYSFLSFATK